MIASEIYYNKLMKGKALRKHSLHEKTAASVLLKLFIDIRQYLNFSLTVRINFK